MTETAFKINDLIENRYRVLSVIGSGGMGALYQVADEVREKEILGLKIIGLNALRTEQQAPECFQREFKLLTQLRHPNLVSVYDFGITLREEFYFTMEWVQGRALDPGSRSWDPAATVPVMVQVCRALSYLHGRGVVHGDLKPANVLMTGDQVKIVDFGVALETKSNVLRTQYYTLGYSAPEFKLDHRMDLYSLGATWYALLLGEPPMFMSGAEHLIRLMLMGTLEAQTRVPTELGEIIAKLLAPDPQDRYNSANEVIGAVNQFTGSHYALETRETARSYALRARFVGRETEIHRLQDLWEHALERESKLVLINGESGVGKTRLVEEFVVQAELKGASVARGQCVEGDGIAYRAWREVLRTLIRYVEGANGTDFDLPHLGAVLSTLLPELEQRPYMQGVAPLAGLDAQAAQWRLNHTITQVLEATARLRSTMVVIEDAHWADQATLELLGFLARIPTQTGLLVCITYRDDEIGPEHPLSKLCGKSVARISLSCLSPQITSDLAQSMLGLAELPVILTERLQATTGGNAFFIQELIRSLAEEGVVLRRTVTGWQVDHAALRQAQLPAGIRQVVERRLGRLSTEGQQALRWAAIVGPLFWEGLIVEIGRFSRDRARAALSEGLDRGLIFQRETSAFEGEREFLFAKHSVQEASYENTSHDERRQVHDRVAEWLIARGDTEGGEHLGLIADHLEKAGRTEPAVPYLLRAGEQAATQFANSEAVVYFSRAMALAPENDRAMHYMLLQAREKMYDRLGAREAQQQDLTSLRQLVQTMGDAFSLTEKRRQTELALRWANFAFTTGDYRAAIAATQEATRLARAAQEPCLEATGFLQRGEILWRQGEYNAARPALEEAIALARTAETRHVKAAGLRYLGRISWSQGNHAEARIFYEQPLRIFREIGNRQGEGWVLNDLGLVSGEQGDYIAARSYYQQAQVLFSEIGDRRGEGWVAQNFGWIFDIQGDYAGARSCYEQGLLILREIGDREGVSTALCYLGSLCHNQGDDETAWEYSRQALHIAEEIGSRRFQGYILTNLGHALAGLGRLAESADAYLQAVKLRRELNQNNLVMESLAGLGRVFLVQGDLCRAQIQVEEILKHLQSHTLEGTDMPFQVYLTSYRILHANQDPRAQTVLNTAYQLLQEQAAKITDDSLKHSFLKNVAPHHEIVTEFTKDWEKSEDQGRKTDVRGEK